MLTDFEPASTAARTLERALGAIRLSVRAEKPYVVGGVAEPEVKLNQNESPYDLPGPAKRALFEAFMAVPFNRYPAEQPFALREALAARHGVDPACVIVGNGSNELTYTIGLCLISPGTPVVLPRPMFSLYEKVVALHGGRLVPVAPKADYGFDVDALEAAIRRERPAYAVVTTPNNPTGRAVAFADVVRLAEAHYSESRVSHEPCCHAHHDEAALRPHHQHHVGGGQLWQRRAVQLRCCQGWGGRHDAGIGQRAGLAQHHRQLHRPRFY